MKTAAFVLGIVFAGTLSCASSSNNAPPPVDTTGDATIDSTSDMALDAPPPDTSTDGAGDAVADGASGDTSADADGAVDAPPEAAPDVAPADASPLERKCLDAGGTLNTGLCCNATTDFPDLCSAGACGCAPSSSHAVEVCLCPTGKCFDGSTCLKWH